MLSKEVWRSIKPLGRFILNEALIDGSLDVLPFGRGTSFATRVSDLAFQGVKSARELLKIVISLITEYHKRLIINSTSHDIGMLQIEDTNHADGAVVTYNYLQGLVQVRSVHIHDCEIVDWCFLAVRASPECT